MKKKLNEAILLICSLIFLSFLLFHSRQCILYASQGLLIWYQNMIPSLFPFMVLSGFMIRSGISIRIGQLLQPILGLFFPLSSQMLYAIFMGFLCGFPMGAKIVTELLEKEEITLKEATYLLSFCNNIGPLYLLGYVMNLFPYNKLPFLGFMYLIPLLYGYITRIFMLPKTSKKNTTYKSSLKSTENLLLCFQNSLLSAIEQITMLGGCMIIFNCFQIIPNYLLQLFTSFYPHISSNLLHGLLCSLLEIGGGLKALSIPSISDAGSSNNMFLVLSLLSFGGISCLFQTCLVIKNTNLKISTYIKHKVIQSSIFIILFFINHAIHL